MLLEIQIFINNIIINLVNYWIAYILMILSLLITIAFYTLAERKFMGSIQRRKGPDVVGFLGLLQAIADGVKLVLKEVILPYKISLVLFLIGPSLVFFLSLCGWVVLPFSDVSFVSVINVSILFVFVTSGFNIYGLVLSGWSSNSRYAFLGAIRATAQMISYELVLGMVNLFIFFVAGSFNLTDIVKAQLNIWFIFPLFPVFITFLIVMLAETNRTPFDLAEAEAELVAGYNVEYSSITFALFFLGEYANMIFLSFLGTIYFLGGWNIPFFPYYISGVSEFMFIFKVLIFCMFFIWIRATLPRYRYDQLMELAWKVLLPILFSFFLVVISVLSFWKQWTFYFTVLFVFIFNTVYLLIYFLSNIHLFSDNVVYMLPINSKILLPLGFLNLSKASSYSIINPCFELLNIFNSTYSNNGSYYRFFSGTNLTKHYQQIITTVQDYSYDSNVSKYHNDCTNDLKILLKQKSKFYNLMNYNIKSLFQAYLTQRRVEDLIQDVSYAHSRIIVLNDYINTLNKQKFIIDNIFNKESRFYLFKFNKEFAHTMVVIHPKKLNGMARDYFNVLDLKLVPVEKLAYFWENTCKSDVDKLFLYYAPIRQKLAEFQYERYSLIYNILSFYLEPFYAPFVFFYKFYEIAYMQAFQIISINLFRPEYTSIIQDQALINAKYV